MREREFLFAFFIICCLLPFIQTQQKPSPKDQAKTKCDKRIRNETELSRCKECVEIYKLPEYPTKNEVKIMLRECVPKKDPKEWLKAKCEENTEKQDLIIACFECVDKYILPQNVTRDDVKAMRVECLPKPSLKFRFKRKCVKKFNTKVDIDTCQHCVQTHNLPDNASCDEIQEMKRQCLSQERSGREMWTEPLQEDDDD